MIGMGHKKSDHYQRAYYKTTDKAGKIKLAPDQRRVRIENNYSGQALPVTVLADLSGFRFETLARTGFSFRELREDHGNKLIELADSAYALKVGKLEPRRSPTPRGKAVWRNSGRSTQAMKLLNEQARQKLRDLSERWARQNACETPHKRQQEATESCNPEAQAVDTTDKLMSSFSVDFLRKIPYFMRVSRTRPNNYITSTTTQRYISKQHVNTRSAPVPLNKPISTPLSRLSFPWLVVHLLMSVKEVVSKSLKACRDCFGTPITLAADYNEGRQPFRFWRACANLPRKIRALRDGASFLMPLLENFLELFKWPLIVQPGPGAVV